MALRQKKTGAPSLYWYLFFALIFFIQVFPRFGMDSPASDEVVDVGDGYYYWKGDVISDSRHPPLAKALQALPARFMGLESKAKASFTNYERRDYNFLFVLNRTKFEGVMEGARWVSLLSGLGIGYLLFLLVRGAGMPVLIFTMAFWALDPTLLAFSGLALADVPLAFLYLISVLSFRKSLENPGDWRNDAITGILTGMAVTTKFSAVLLIPVYLILELFRWLNAKAGREKDLGGVGRRWLTGLAGALAFISVLYLPGSLKMPDHRNPLGYFWDGFKAMAVFSGHPTYFLGELTTRNHWAYYPLALLLKSPLPFLLFLFLSIGLAALGKIKFPLWRWMPGLILFLAVSPFHNIGIREVLPAFPFFILLAGSGAGWLWTLGSEKRRLWPKLLAGIFIFFQAASVGLQFPGQISYFNELVPAGQKIYWLGDSNLDIGQDTKRLALKARQMGWGRVKLAYFGNANPELYGLKWDNWTQKDLEGPQPGQVYAINAAFLQLGPAFLPGAGAINQGWISKIPPTGMVGDTWYYFVMPGQAGTSGASPDFPSTLPFKIYDHLND